MKKITNKIGSHNFILIIFIFIALLSTTFYQSFSLYTESGSLSLIEGIETYSFILNNSNNTNSVTIKSRNNKYIDITVSNESDISLLYGISYTTSSNLNNVNIGYLESTTSLPNDTITNNSQKIVTIKIDNNSSNDITINFNILFGFENNNQLTLEDNHFWIEEYKADAPSIPTLNNDLVPIYYDNTTEVWKIADSTNTNNSWYDYENNLWANAVI